MASDKDKLFFAATLDQRFLQIHPVDTRHLHIHDRARRAAVGWTREKIGCGFKNFAFVPGGAEQSRQALSHRRVIVDHEDQAVWNRHMTECATECAVLSMLTGRVK